MVACVVKDTQRKLTSWSFVVINHRYVVKHLFAHTVASTSINPSCLAEELTEFK